MMRKHWLYLYQLQESATSKLRMMHRMELKGSKAAAGAPCSHRHQVASEARCRAKQSLHCQKDALTDNGRMEEHETSGN